MDTVTPIRSGPIWQNLIPGDQVRTQRGRRVGEVVAIERQNSAGQHMLVQVCWDDRCRDWSIEATDCLVLIRPAAVLPPRPGPEEIAKRIAELTRDCQSRCIQLYVEDDRLRWKAPRGAMDVELLKRLKALEPDLLGHLSGLTPRLGQGAHLS